MSKETVLQILNETLKDALEKDVPEEQVETLAQLAGQVALGEIEVKQL